MSTAALELAPKNQLAITSEQLELAKSTIAKDLTDAEFELYKYNCHRQGVHPLDGLIIPIKRNDSEAGGKKLTFVTTVDLLRSRAAETNEYAGSDDAVFQYDIEQKPEAATVTVWRFVQGERCPFTATARWQEYFPGERQGFMWKTKPHVMIGKCAEGLALRKAFPKQLAGLYLEEELQKDALAPTRTKKDKPAPVGNVKCSKCGAVNGHLPSCETVKPAAKSENVICGDCGKTNGHEPTCKYAKTSPPAQPEAAKPSPQEAAASGLKKVAVLILGIERLNTKADAKGKTRPYMRLRVVAPDDTEGFLYVWHATPQGHLTDAVIDKPLLCEVSAKKQGDKDYYSVENILEVGGVPWSNNMPSPKDDDF